MIAAHYGNMGFITLLEFRDVDLFVDKGSEKVAVEVESLSETKDYVRAVHNILKASRIADRVESVVENKKKARKLKEAVQNSPLKSYRGLSIKLPEEYNCPNLCFN